MRKVGVKTSQIMDYMVQVTGGYRNVRFTTKDLYNYANSDRREQILDSDAETTIAYITYYTNEDPEFQYQYTVDKENRLKCFQENVSRCETLLVLLALTRQL